MLDTQVACLLNSHSTCFCGIRSVKRILSGFIFFPVPNCDILTEYTFVGWDTENTYLVYSPNIAHVGFHTNSTVFVFLLFYLVLNKFSDLNIDI